MAATAFPPPGQAWATGAAYPLDFCHLCDGPINRIAPRAVGTYTDRFGFRYRLCAGCYPALLRGLLKAEHARPSANAVHRPWHRNRPTRRILAAGNHADGGRASGGAGGDAGGA